MRQLFGLVAVFVIGCGGGGESKPDAKVFMDAPMPDASTALTGLGKTCVLAMGGADCPMTGANGCLGPFVMGGTMGFCTAVCVNNGTFMTGADSKVIPTSVMPADLTAQNATCAGLYVGPTGFSGSCTLGSGGILFNRMPTGNLMANMNYTFQIACGIGCGAGNTCPTGMTCETTSLFCKVP